MRFTFKWTEQACEDYENIRNQAAKNRSPEKRKSSRQEGLFKQVNKTLDYLSENPRHPSLQTHEYDSLAHPYKTSEKVFEAGAYRIFWCYGPDKSQITILAITSHP